MATVFTFGNVYTDFTRIFASTSGDTVFSSNLAQTTSFDYFSNTPTVGDSIYFYLADLKSIKLFVGTPLVGTDVVLQWEYWHKDSTGAQSWIPITVQSDGTSGFTIAGENVVEFGSYYVAFQKNIGGTNGSYIRCRLVSFTTITEGGAQSTQKVQGDKYHVYPTGSTEASPFRLQDVYDYMTTSYAHWKSTKIGNIFIFDYQIDCDNSGGQWLKMANEFLVIGNGNLWERFKWGKLLSGIKDTSGVTKDGSTIYMRAGGSCSSVVNFNYAEAKIYDSRITLGTYWGWNTNGSTANSIISCLGGYFSVARGEFQDTTLEGGNGQGYNSDVTFKNILFHTNIWIMTGGNPTFDDVSVSNPNSKFNGFYCYAAPFILKNFKYGDYNSLFYLYQTYTDITIDCINPSPALEPLTSKSVVKRTVRTATVGLQSLLNYDNTSGFTDQTVQGGDAIVDDVNLTGATGIPEVGDCIYFKLRDSADNNNYFATDLDMTMGSTVNTDNIYIWEKWDGTNWIQAVEETDVWDITKVGNFAFAKSGIIYIRRLYPYKYTTVNGVNGVWLRARIITAGSSKPLATTIWKNPNNISTGISNWLINEKYTFNLTVQDTYGNVINGAIVSVIDSNGTTVANTTTDSFGKIVAQDIIVGYYKFDPKNSEYQGMVKVIVNPITIKIKKSGYKTYIEKFDLTQKTDWVIALSTRRFIGNQPQR
ncbi:hypothetical protein BMS3Abin17_00046 [archaeon BMS3Abin17]|nr:hypothetical protein BMS3Abin17_00046 [archaeon BMS3Abin17]